MKTGRNFEDIFHAGVEASDVDYWAQFLKLRAFNASARKTADTGRAPKDVATERIENNLFAFHCICGYLSNEVSQKKVKEAVPTIELDVPAVPVNILANFASSIVPSAADLFAFKVSWNVEIKIV